MCNSYEEEKREHWRAPATKKTKKTIGSGKMLQTTCQHIGGKISNTRKTTDHQNEKNNKPKGSTGPIILSYSFMSFKKPNNSEIRKERISQRNLAPESLNLTSANRRGHESLKVLSLYLITLFEYLKSDSSQNQNP